MVEEFLSQSLGQFFLLIVTSGSEEMLMPTAVGDEHHSRKDCGHEVLSPGLAIGEFVSGSWNR